MQVTSKQTSNGTMQSYTCYTLPSQSNTLGGHQQRGTRAELEELELVLEVARSWYISSNSDADALLS
eukprot:3741-Heterococcus_DN1.PRE.5